MIRPRFPAAVAVLLAVGCTHLTRKTLVPPATDPPAAPASAAAESHERPALLEVSATLPKLPSIGGLKVVAPTEIACQWEPRVAYLPDPTRNGAMSPGLAGQVFLFGPNLESATADGDVTVELFDETKGANGVRLGQWTFDKETFKKMAATDETWGRSYTMFLPWPDYKSTVTRVNLRVKYVPTKGHTLFAPSEPVTIDPTGTTCKIERSEQSTPIRPAPGAVLPASGNLMGGTPLGGPPPGVR